MKTTVVVGKAVAVRTAAVLVMLLLAAALALAGLGCGQPVESGEPDTSTTTPPASAPTTSPTANTAVPAAAVDYWPTAGWRQSTPEEQGMSSRALAKLFDRINQQQLDLHSLLVVRNGYVVTEAYWNPYTADEPVDVQSVTKSVMSALVGIAIDKGYISDEDATVLSFFPNETVAALDERKKALTVADLLTMTSGLAYSDESDPALDELSGSPDWISFLLDQPIAAEPGSAFSYSSGSTHILSGILAAATNQTPRLFANQNLFNPIGISPVTERGWASDPQGLAFGGTGLWLTSRDMAKLGYLYLNNGLWDGQQVISPAWIAKSTEQHSIKDDGWGYGYLWTLDAKQGSFTAHGRGGQEIIVSPAKRLVVVMTAGLQPGQSRDFSPLKALFDDYILPAITSDAPLPLDPTGDEELDSRVRQAICPLRSVPALPVIAHEVDGRIYDLAPNSAGFHTIQIRFPEGEAQAYVVIDGTPVDPPVGLDNIYRVGIVQDGTRTCLRGSWGPDDSFIIQQVVALGELTENTCRLSFQGEHMTMKVSEFPSGNEMTIEGTMRPVKASS